MTTSFQQELAKDLLDRYSEDLSSLVVIFPSLRARAFFNDRLSSLVTRPVWQPSWMSIDELMEQQSGLVKGEKILLISELYTAYKRQHPSESLDKFYYWGEMLLADFDLIDKYMVDASQLLRNLKEIKELEADVSYLTPEQLRIISFWRSVDNGTTLSEQKQAFLKVWNSLYRVYTDFRERLFKLGIGYTGMIYREAAERIKRGEASPLPEKHFIVAGFNALSESEKVLFNMLKTSSHGADFYWDYDSYYVDNHHHEAGMFLRENIAHYPAAESISHHNFNGTDKRLKAIACVSNVVQCKYVADILRALPREELDKRTAIVLTDENLLIPLLHSLPECVEKVNVTMGYPLKNTLVYTFIERLIALQSNSKHGGEDDLFYHVDVVGLLSHPYLTDTHCDQRESLIENIAAEHMITVKASYLCQSDLLAAIFCRATEWHTLAHYLLNVLNLLAESITSHDEIHAEYLRIAIDEISKSVRSIRKCGIEPSVKVFTSMLKRHLQTVTIPYEGEPLEGVQIMGILETRNIDFKNVIILSMTDDNFPGDRTSQSSFIPYNLRAAYNMPTPEKHEAMYAYYFYRLIQRAESVSMLYCSRADEKSTGEQSRYIYQLDFESGKSVERISVGVDLSLGDSAPIEIAKSAAIQQKLDRYLRHDSGYALSPTALFKHVECPLKFYFAHIAHLKSPDELSDTIDAPTFGNILHEAMQLLYTPILNADLPRSSIVAMRKTAVVEQAVDRCITKLLLHGDEVHSSEFSGDMLLVRDIIVKYIMRGVMRHDAQRDDFSVVGLERDVECRYPIAGGREVNLAGRADRIDRLADGSLQVIDYKSGNTPHLEFNSIENLFRGEPRDRISNVFQTLLYAMMLRRCEGGEAVPSLYYAAKMLNKDYSEYLMDRSTGELVACYGDVSEVFESELSNNLDELFDYNTPFRQAEDEDMCKYCDFKKICRR